MFVITEVRELGYYCPKLPYLEAVLINRMLEQYAGGSVAVQLGGTILKAVDDLIMHLPQTHGQYLVMSAQKRDTRSRKQGVVLAMSPSPLHLKRHWDNFIS